MTVRSHCVRTSHSRFRLCLLGPSRLWRLVLGRGGAISGRMHHGAAAPAGITGIQSAEGCSASCRIVLVAETNSRLVACTAPVFRLRSKRGKLLLETSSRRRWPFLKTLLVAHRS